MAYFIVAINISGEFNVNYEQELYDMKIKAFETSAVLYGTAKEELFVEETDVYVTVDDLAQAGFVISTDGVVQDPRNEDKNLNNIKIKITKKDDEVKAQVLV